MDTQTGRTEKSDPLAHRDTLKKTIAVDYLRSKQEALHATEHGRNVNEEAIAGAIDIINQAPEYGEGIQEILVYFIPFAAIPDRYRTDNGEINDHALEVFLKEHGLKSVDLHTAAAISEHNPGFSYRHKYAIHFSDGEGGWYSAIFYDWLDGRSLAIGRRTANWQQHRGWHFAVTKA